MSAQAWRGAVAWFVNWRARCSEPVLPSGLFTIKEVSQACGLPGPVIMQWVPRTWVDDVGWMFTAEQVGEAVAIAEGWRRSRGEQSDPSNY